MFANMAALWHVLPPAALANATTGPAVGQREGRPGLAVGGQVVRGLRDWGVRLRVRPSSVTAPAENLRIFLREETAGVHDVLDRTMRAATGWESRADYARFLALQYAARAPVERWIADNLPADLAPPASTHLIERDLAALGEEPPRIAGQAAPPFTYTDSSRSAALGIGWVLAGSSLGNRAILARIKRICAPDDVWPHAFLGDDAMPAYWFALRREIERPADIALMESARAAALAVFEHFISLAETELQKHKVEPNAERMSPALMVSAP